MALRGHFRVLARAAAFRGDDPPSPPRGPASRIRIPPAAIIPPPPARLLSRCGARRRLSSRRHRLACCPAARPAGGLLPAVAGSLSSALNFCPRVGARCGVGCARLPPRHGCLSRRTCCSHSSHHSRHGCPSHHTRCSHRPLFAPDPTLWPRFALIRPAGHRPTRPTLALRGQHAYGSCCECGADGPQPTTPMAPTVLPWQHRMRHWCGCGRSIQPAWRNHPPAWLPSKPQKPHAARASLPTRGRAAGPC
jgi:hypothetical protein